MNGERVGDLRQIAFPGEYVFRLGKKWKRVTG